MMKNKVISCCSIGAVTLLTAGCVTTGLSSRDDGNSYAALVSSGYQKAPPGEPPGRVTLPIRLAVAQIGEPAPEAAFLKELGRDPGIIKSVSPLPMSGNLRSGYGSSVTQSNTQELLAAQVLSARNLAREMGAQYLLLVGGSVESFSSHNPLSVLDLTIVGGMLLPGSKVQMQGKAAAALIHAPTGRVVLLNNVELTKTGFTPSFYVEERRDEMSVEMRTEALQQLAADVLSRLAKTHDQSVAQ